MKLIKQNDSAGGLIFKQNTAGKAMKQNYNFGKAFKFSNPSIRASSDFNHTMTNGFSFLVWGRNWAGGSDFSSYIIFTFDNTITLAIRPRGTTNLLRFTVYDDPILGTLDRPNVGAHNNTSFLAGVINNTIIYNGSAFTFTGMPDNYFIGKTLTNISFPDSLPHVGLVNDLIVYDRNITDTEISYFFNNKLGNEELNSVGLVAKYKNDAATIVDNSVVIKNYAGVENLELINLPSGTLEEQRDYANDNLFEPW